MSLPSEYLLRPDVYYCTCKHQIKFETNLPTFDESYILSSRGGPAGISYSENIVANINIDIYMSSGLQTSEVFYQMQGNNYYVGFYDQQGSSSVGGKWYLDGVELSTVGYTTIDKTSDHTLYYEAPDVSANSAQLIDDAINPIEPLRLQDVVDAAKAAL